MLTGKQKRYLRSQGMTMKPLINLGKNGLSQTFVAGVADAVDKRELVKISLLPAAEDTPQTVGAFLTTEIPGLEVAQTIGRTLLVYRVASKEENRHISAALAKL
ncbi:YhbY family RNA-binding protein [Lacticaseibacillus daqingensis]|uniref:YhbY family RNA-binding protein n=1 Tax=Lacticaseibacillus daqingensis TaxID=2486014 RepID=UPI000F77BEB4|nr:YhbY family RNA-binding protein [Lacticaseibacillus daqingensis]